MQRSIYLTILLLMLIQPLLAQPDAELSWTWVAGERFPANTHFYGAKGVESPSNLPPHRRAAISWTDSSGLFWMFGGSAYAGKMYNDLWRFNPMKNLWTWISGDSVANQPGIFGIQGIASSTNKPGARDHSIAWVSNNNQLWLFGGNFNYNNTVYGTLGDLWKYDIPTGQWTWVNGSSQPDAHAVFGIKGIENPANYPGATYLSNAWQDHQGRFWMFGGFSFRESGTIASASNKLWRYDPVSNNWTWIKGDASGNRENFGTQHIQLPSNNPGGRLAATTWTDKSGNFWLFGGEFTNGIKCNDLWKYDISSNNWVWEKGSIPPDMMTDYWPAIYGIRDSAENSNNPGSRQGAIGWTDGNDRLWLFGGLGTITEHSLGDLNDLWSYDLLTGMWTWIKGDSLINAPGHYGTQGVADTLNEPPGRELAVSWKDRQGNNWLFGGSFFFNDIWKIGSNGFSGTTVLQFRGDPIGEDIRLQWETNREFQTDRFLLERSGDRSAFDSLVSIPAAGYSVSPRAYIYTDLDPLPDTNYYRLKIVNRDGHFSYSDTIAVKSNATAPGIGVFPNPVQDVLIISYQPGDGPVALRLFDATGRVLIWKEMGVNAGSLISLDVRHLPSAVYFVALYQQGRVTVRKVFKK